MRLVFGTAGGAATDVEDPSAVIDAEFLFLQGVHSDAGTALQSTGWRQLQRGMRIIALYGRNA